MLQLDQAAGTRSIRYQRLLPFILAIHASLLTFNAVIHSPTLNEPGHLVAGLSHWNYGNFTLYRVNPPLVRMVAALPGHLLGYQEVWDGYFDGVGARPEFLMGEMFIKRNGRRSFFLLTMGRIACIPFSLLGGWICFKWASELYCRSAGYLACILWCFSPMVLGHAAVIAPDAHATSLGVAACYTFWRWLKNPTWIQAVITGGVLGLAELSKTTMILFYPLWPLLWLLYRIPSFRQMTSRQWMTEAAMLTVRMAIGIYVLNLGYLAEGTAKPLGEFKFVSELFAGKDAGPDGGNRFQGTLWGSIPVPFPSNYVLGIDVQQHDFEDFSLPSYLRGQYQAKGWWYYYVYAVLVKAPLGSLLLVIPLALLRRSNSIDRRWNDLLILLSPAAVIFVVSSLKSGFSHHSRYILPCFPFVFIWLSQLARPAEQMLFSCFRHFRGRRTRRLRPGCSRIPGALTVVLVGWSVCSSLAVYPHSLSHFNELAGGSRNGPEHLINSNVDWGQDLLNLEKWVKANADGRPVYLAFYNYYNPFDVGIDDLENWPFLENSDSLSYGQVVPEGFYAISVNLLYDFPWTIRLKNGERGYIAPGPNAYLRSIDPVGQAGLSIRIYSAEQMRTAFSVPSDPPLWDPGQNFNE